jgi:hypothetical protein
VFIWAVKFLGTYFGKSNIAAYVAASKEDCLAKLLEYDFSPDGLPVGLGGSWTGGCEPWRKGCPNGAELTLEIETDLSCLLRSTLWLHNQAVAARQQSRLEAADAVLNGPHHEAMPASTTATNEQKAASKPLLLGRLRAKDDVASVQPKARAKSVDRAMSFGPRNRKPAPNNQQKARAKSLERQQQQPSREERISFPIASLPRAEQPVEEQNFRRKRDVVYSKNKRERKKIEVEVLQKQERQLSTCNQALRSESERLEELLRTAQEEIKRRGGCDEGDRPLNDC